MEKPVSSRKLISIFKYLQKPTLLLITRPPSIKNSRKRKIPHKRSLPSPILSIIPLDACYEKKIGGIQSQEPTSPKVSCMGQIKHKAKGSKPRKSPAMQNKTKPSSSIQKMFQSKVRPSPIAREEKDETWPVAPVRAPSISEMRRFNCGRDTLRGFDWMAAVSELDAWPNVDDKSEIEEMVMPNFAPVLAVGGAVGLETRKEINLWKRRNVASLAPLHLN